MGFRKIVEPIDKKNELLSKKIIEVIEEKFPIKGNSRTLKISNIKTSEMSNGYSAIKKAVSSKTSVMSKITATLSLFTKEGKLLDRDNVTLLRIPIVTKKNNFMIDGNSYSVINQQRLKSGVYTYRRGDGVVYATVKPENGRDFKFYISDDNTLKLSTASKQFNAYSVISGFGISKNELEKVLGKEIASKYVSDKNTFERFKEEVFYNPDEELKIDKHTSSLTINDTSGKIGKNSLLKTLEKLKNVSMKKLPDDEPENMVFKKIMTPPDLISEQYSKALKDIIYNLKFKLNNGNTKKVSDLFSGTTLFTKPLKNVISSSKLSRIPDEYNPINSAMYDHLITPMGEGGVGDTKALGLKQKAVHHSQLGFIDPVVSPEGASVGITLAVTKNAYVSDNGDPAIKVINAKTGKKEIVTLYDLWKKKLAYPPSEKGGNFARVQNDDIPLKTLKSADYIIPSSNDMHAPSAEFIPMFESIDANRTNMAQKHIQQALPLDDPDTPNVNIASENGTTGEEIASNTGSIIKSKFDGVVSKIDKEFIYIKTKDGVKKVEYATDVPFSTKTFLSHKIRVNVGDKVKKGTLLADSNFAKDGTMAIGKNLKTAWLTMPGNRNDGVIISESAAEKLASIHLYKEKVHVDSKDIFDLRKALLLFPNIESKINKEKYDSRGIVKEGSILSKGEPMVIKISPTDHRQIKSKLSNVIQRPFQITLVTWKKEDEGHILKSTFSGNSIVIEAKVRSRAKIGDKLSARAGNKGIISEILPDDEMPQMANGKPIDMALTAAGIVSRVNPGVLEEGALGRVADHKGIKFTVPRYGLKDNLKESKKIFQDTFKQQKETLINPATGKPFPQKIFVGQPYVVKLFKDGEGATSGVGIGAVDQNEQAVKGGKESAASVSNMEVNALLAHGTHRLLKDIRDVTGQKNDEYFQSFLSGSPILPKTKTPYAFEKFTTLLEQMNVKVDKNDDNKTFQTKMISSKDIIKDSNGEVKQSDTINIEKKQAIKNGLFDDKIFGGLSGSKKGYIKLPTPILNPLHKDEISYMLGISNKELEHKIANGKLHEITSKLKEIKIPEEKSKIEKIIKNERDPDKLNKEFKTLNYLKEVEKSNLNVYNASTMTAVSVIPPKFRPVTLDKREVSLDNLNVLYQDIIDLSNELKKNPKDAALQKDLQDSVGALFGTNDSPNPKIDSTVTKGILPLLKGENPKQSFAQRVLTRKKQFISGRGVIKPARTDIGIDEIELPENIALKIYKPHIERELSKKGLEHDEIEEMIEHKDKQVLDVLNKIVKEYPVYYSRAPSLWKHNIIGAIPKIVKGNTIGINQLLERGFGADYDGDAIAVYATMTKEAARDVKEKMFPSKNLFTEDKGTHDPDLIIMPDQDSSLGFFKASKASNKKPVKVGSIQNLLKMLKDGDINYNDKVLL